MATLSPMKRSIEGKTTPLFLSPVKINEAKTPVKINEAKTPVRVKSESKTPGASTLKHSEGKIALSFSPTKSVLSPSAVPYESPVKRAGKSVQRLYQVIQKATGAVGGYGHNGPVYGEVTMGTFQKVVDAMSRFTEFDASSSFVDVGAGLGKPSFHVALNPGVKLSAGIELEQLRFELSMHNLRFVRPALPELRDSVVYFAREDATNMGDFENFTHVYMFDVGFPPSVLVSLANSFNRSKCVKALVSFQRPDRVISVYGFGVELVHQVQTRMNGSSEQHTAYIYRAKHAAKDKPRYQSQLRSFLVNKDDLESPQKLKQSGSEILDQSKKYGMFAELQKLDYGSYVTSTGLLGEPGDRPKRSALAPVKYTA